MKPDKVEHLITAADNYCIYLLAALCLDSESKVVLSS